MYCLLFIWNIKVNTVQQVNTTLKKKDQTVKVRQFHWFMTFQYLLESPDVKDINIKGYRCKLLWCRTAETQECVCVCVCVSIFVADG